LILRDAVHGLVTFERDEERLVVELLDCIEVQRLRHIRQLGVASMAFPGAEHSRFAHAIGAAYVMKKLIERLRTLHEELPYWQRLTSERAQDALAAALLHDLGHGPLSHLFEDAIDGSPHHEEWTRRILLDPQTSVHQTLAKRDPSMPERVARLVHGESDLPYLARSVSGLVDVDRCDYLLRDAHATGVRYGMFDLDWLLRSLRFADHPETGAELAIDGAKGLPAIEGFVLARLFMFQQVYLHKATRSAEWMIRTALARGVRGIAEGLRIPSGGVPTALRQAALGQDPELAAYLQLGDPELILAMKAWEGSSDAGLGDLCRRVRARVLHKTYELFGSLASHDGRRFALETARTIASANGFDPELAVGCDVAEVEAFDATDTPIQVVYQKGRPRVLHEVSFVLARLANQTLERVRLIVVPEIREQVVAALQDKNQ
jgi:uncharacterized protein